MDQKKFVIANIFTNISFRKKMAAPIAIVLDDFIWMHSNPQDYCNVYFYIGFGKLFDSGQSKMKMREKIENGLVS